MTILNRPFKLDPNISGSVSIFDIFLICLAAFGIFPASFFAAGYALSLIAFDEGIILGLAGLLVAIGYTGLYAWMAIPVFFIIGWFASRRGWIGYGSAVLLGAIGGLIFGSAFWLIDGSGTSIVFALIFVLPATVYALVGWAALRFLRPDIFQSDL